MPFTKWKKKNKKINIKKDNVCVWRTTAMTLPNIIKISFIHGQALEFIYVYGIYSCACKTYRRSFQLIFFLFRLRWRQQKIGLTTNPSHDDHTFTPHALLGKKILINFTASLPKRRPHSRSYNSIAKRLIGRFTSLLISVFKSNMLRNVFTYTRVHFACNEEHRNGQSYFLSWIKLVLWLFGWINHTAEVTRIQRKILHLCRTLKLLMTNIQIYPYVYLMNRGINMKTGNVANELLLGWENCLFCFALLHYICQLNKKWLNIFHSIKYDLPSLLNSNWVDCY